MRTFSRGVTYYTKAVCEISFPEDDICCYRCPLMGNDFGREYCKKTGEYLPAPRDMAGVYCPLVFRQDKGEREL